jgi:hypothetical protein
MINLEFTGMCAGCEIADLDLVSQDFLSGKRVWAVTCSHRRACIAARDKIKDDLAQVNRAIEGRRNDE